MKKIKVDKDLLYHYYIEENYNIEDTANLMSISYRTIQRAIKEFDFNKDKNQISNTRKITLQEKYGIDNVYQLDNVKDKCKQTKLERYGSETYNNTEKQKQTMLDKYGVTCGYNTGVAESTIRNNHHGNMGYAAEDIKVKIINTMNDRYGVEYPMQNDEILAKSIETQKMKNNGVLAWNTEKALNTRINKYGTISGFNSKKTLLTMTKRYGVKYTVHNKELFNKMKQTNLERYGVEYACLTDNCINNNGHTISKTNLRFQKYLLDNGIQSELEFRIKNQSFDLHIKNSNILIEINPTYTHNSTKAPHFSKNAEPTPYDYHYNKCRFAIDNGYELISIFEWMNLDKVLDIIKAKLHKLDIRIGANKCKVKEITQKEANLFLDKYHIQGAANSQCVCIGLFYKDELVQVQTFGKPRYNNKVDWEAIRLASKHNTYIIGGVSKGFKYFVDKYNPQTIISYNSLNISTGKTDDAQGFKLKGFSKSQGIWINTKHNNYPRYIRNSSLRVLGIDKVLGVPADKFPDYDGTYETSNEALIIREGYVKVYDCGNVTYLWTKD